MRARAFSFIPFICGLLFAFPSIGQGDWPTVKENGKGSITIYWFRSPPFIYRDDQGKLTGIEYEFIEGFKKFVQEKHNVELAINWTEGDSFIGTYNTIKEGKIDGTFGSSFFSITPERQKEVSFAPSYLADISVLISSYNIPVVGTIKEFDSVFSSLTALTIRHTTYEEDLVKLKRSANLGFTIKYIPSSQDIILTLSEKDNMFAFVDLPVYMTHFKTNPSLRVKRQNLFPIIREGYAILMPKESSWLAPMSQYFTDPEFLIQKEKVIGAYIDPELYKMVENLSVNANDPISLLTREKEIQFMDILEKRSQLEDEARLRYLLIAFLSVTLVSLGIIIIQYRKRNEQQRKIEFQNTHLVKLDEEKNMLIKILAHDLRTPISHVQGLSQLLLIGNQLSEEQTGLVNNISTSSARLNKMITNILDIDAIEHNRTKLSFERVPVGSLVRKVGDSFQKDAEQKGITIVFADTASRAMYGDPIFLIQIFENLISNAIKFSEKGKKIELRIGEANGKVKISVQDEGPGIPPTDIPLLFTKFKKLSTRPTAGESSIGLGLSIVKKYVELMNGRVWCESEVGKGTRFMVEFVALRSE